MYAVEGYVEDKRMRRRRHGLRARLWLGLGLIGAMAGWEGAASQPALAQYVTEELFSPYIVSRLLPPASDRLSDSPSDPGSLPFAGGAPPGVVERGVRLVKQGQYAQAITLLEPYRVQDDFLTLHALGVAYVRTNKNQEAYEVLLRAHHLRPYVAGPLLPAALACARIARRCDDYRALALDYIALGGKFNRFAVRIANHQPFTIASPRRF